MKCTQNPKYNYPEVLGMRIIMKYIKHDMQLVSSMKKNILKDEKFDAGKNGKRSQRLNGNMLNIVN